MIATAATTTRIEPLFEPTFDINKMKFKGVDKVTKEYKLLSQPMQQGILDNMNQKYATAYRQYETFNTLTPIEKQEMINKDNKNSPIAVLQRLKTYIIKKCIGTTNPKDIYFGKDDSELKLEQNELAIVMKKINNLIKKWESLSQPSVSADYSVPTGNVQEDNLNPDDMFPLGGRRTRRLRRQNTHRRKSSTKRHRKKTNRRLQKKQRKTHKRR